MDAPVKALNTEKAKALAAALAQIEKQRRDELLEEEAYRDAAMCAWIESSAQVIEEIAC